MSTDSLDTSHITVTLGAGWPGQPHGCDACHMGLYIVPGDDPDTRICDQCGSPITTVVDHRKRKADLKRGGR